MRLMLQARAGGIMFLTLFGAAWALEAGLRLSLPSIAVTIVFSVVVAWLVILITIRIRGAALSQPEPTVGQVAAQARADKWLYWSMGTEGVALFVICGIALPSLHLMWYIWPTVALIVGLHFYPLAYAFALRIYYVTATLMCLVAIAAIAGIASGALALESWNVIVGFACAGILWGTSGVVILQVRQVLNGLRPLS